MVSHARWLRNPGPLPRAESLFAERPEQPCSRSGLGESRPQRGTAGRRAQPRRNHLQGRTPTMRMTAEVARSPGRMSGPHLPAVPSGPVRSRRFCLDGPGSMWTTVHRPRIRSRARTPPRPTCRPGSSARALIRWSIQKSSSPQGQDLGSRHRLERDLAQWPVDRLGLGVYAVLAHGDLDQRLVDVDVGTAHERRDTPPTCSIHVIGVCADRGACPQPASAANGSEVEVQHRPQRGGASAQPTVQGGPFPAVDEQVGHRGGVRVRGDVS